MRTSVKFEAHLQQYTILNSTTEGRQFVLLMPPRMTENQLFCHKRKQIEDSTALYCTIISNTFVLYSFIRDSISKCFLSVLQFSGFVTFTKYQ